MSAPLSRDDSSTGPITALLRDVQRGSEAAEGALFDLVYEELKVLARARLRSEGPEVSLCTTGLVHEAYLKLLPIEAIDWRDRTHFFATAARAMRRILIDRARGAARLKRGGGRRPVALSEAGSNALPDPIAADADDLLALDEALDRLGALSPRQLRVVELRFFADLSVPETAEVLDVAVNTVKRDWTTARVWLNRELGGGT